MYDVLFVFVRVLKLFLVCMLCVVCRVSCVVLFVFVCVGLLLVFVS
jgi:hypothetical protein